MSLEPRCLSCPTTPPPCPSCSANEQCQVIGLSCTKCSYAICVPIDPSNSGSSSGGGSGISTGAMVGAIVAAVVVLILAALGFFYYRRRRAARRARDVRKSTSTGEKSTRSGRSGRTANNRSPSARVDPRNPFSDPATEEGVSYITPNVNPGPPGTGDEAMPDHPYARATPRPLSNAPLPNAPLRPPRSPDLDLKGPDPAFAKNDKSGDKKDKRQSVQTTGSSIMSDYESAVIYDARTQSATLHVFGAPAKALVVPTNASSASLPLQRSPLGQTAYSAGQGETERDPFADRNNDRPASRNSMSTVVTYDPDHVQIMAATRSLPRQSGSSSGTGHIVAKGPIAARANLLPIRVPPQGMPSLVAYQTAIGQAAARPPPSLHDSLGSGHARHLSSATTATTASGFSTSSSLLSSFPFVPPSPLGLPRQRSPESMTFSVREGEEGLQAIQVDNKPLAPPPQSRPTSAWSNMSGASSAPPHPALPGSVPPVPAIPAGIAKRGVSTVTSRDSTMTTGSILSAFPFHIPTSAHTSALPLSALPSSVALPDHDEMRDSMMPSERMRSERASLDSVVLSKQVGELGNLSD